MDFTLTKEHHMIREACRKLAEKSLKPKAAEYDRTHEFPWEHVKKLSDMGMMGVVYPEQYNGSELDYVSYAIASEEISRGCASTATIMMGHNSLCLSPIYYFGTEKQKENYLTNMTTGERLGCFAVTEAGAGSDVSGVKTKAERKNGSSDPQRRQDIYHQRRRCRRGGGHGVDRQEFGQQRIVHVYRGKGDEGVLRRQD